MGARWGRRQISGSSLIGAKSKYGSDEMIKASETKYPQKFDQLQEHVLAERVKFDTQIPWLSNFLHETGIADCDFVAYYPDSFSDWGFSDDVVRNNSFPQKTETTYTLRVS